MPLLRACQAARDGYTQSRPRVEGVTKSTRQGTAEVAQYAAATGQILEQPAWRYRPGWAAGGPRRARGQRGAGRVRLGASCGAHDQARQADTCRRPSAGPSGYLARGSQNASRARQKPPAGSTTAPQHSPERPGGPDPAAGKTRAVASPAGRAGRSPRSHPLAGRVPPGSFGEDYPLPAIDEFACRIEVTGVACCLSDHMQEDLA
jgi:hypothetical protein